MKIPVLWLSYKKDIPPRGYWDQGMIEAIFSRELWHPNTAYEFDHFEGNNGLMHLVVDNQIDVAKGAVIVLPARHHVDHIDALNQDLSNFAWVVLILTGDEEAKFPAEKLNHPNMRLWVMSPRVGRHDTAGRLGTGFPPQARKLLPKYSVEAHKRPLDYFFSGQITHDRRQQLAKKLKEISSNIDNNKLVGSFHFTSGFTQGLSHDDYYQKLAGAKVAPAPSGPETPDSFRLFEALEAGCIPIADTRVPKGDFADDYWTWFFGEEPPFPVLTDYEQLPGYITESAQIYMPLSNKIFAWWMHKKRQLAYQIEKDINDLVGEHDVIAVADDLVTVIIPTSVIPSHPSTEILEKTITSVRAKLPKAEIFILFDGVRQEQEGRIEDYNRYIHDVLWKCHHEWSNVLPIIFETHQHQANMTRAALKLVRTPTILFVEHDTPLVEDYDDFHWVNMAHAIMEGQANVIRFHHESHVLKEHKHLMFDSQPQFISAVPMQRTMQWSQRPHLASTAFYIHMLDTYFRPSWRTMIEDVMHGVVDSECKRGGLMAWYNFRVWIYTPEGNIKRSYHLDGRGSDEKYEMVFKEDDDE